MAYYGMGKVERKTRTDLALKSYERSLEIRERLARENPSVTDYREALTETRVQYRLLRAEDGVRRMQKLLQRPRPTR